MTPDPAIRAARVMRLRRPLARPIATAFGCLVHRDAWLLVLDGEDGVVGLGEAAPLPERGTEEDAAAERALCGLARSLERGGEGTPRGLGRTASFALSTALADLAARRRGLALAGWLAGSECSGPAAVPVNALLVGETPDALEGEAAAAAHRGHRAVKLKVGQGGLGQDVDRVAAVRGALGPGVAIRADANGAWDPDEARRRLAALRPFDLEYLEQPLPERSWQDLPGLRRKVDVPIAVDESASDLGSLGRLLRAEAADVWVLKPALLGSLERAREAVEMARAGGVGWVLTSLLDGAVACAAALQLAASLGSPLPVCGIGPTPGLCGDIASLPPVVDGAAPLPPGAGLGVALAA